MNKEFSYNTCKNVHDLSPKPNVTCSVIHQTAIKCKNKHTFLMAAMLLFYILPKCGLNKCYTLFRALSPHQTAEFYVKGNCVSPATEVCMVTILLLMSGNYKQHG